MPLLRRLVAIPPYPRVDESGEPVELRNSDRRRAPVSRRDREFDHLLHALARDPNVARRCTRAHPVPARQTDLAIELHSVNPPALPVTGKCCQTGRIFLRRSETIPPLRLAQFVTAVCIHRDRLESGQVDSALVQDRLHPLWPSSDAAPGLAGVLRVAVPGRSPTPGASRGGGPELGEDIAQLVAFGRHAAFELGLQILSVFLFTRRHLGLGLAQQLGE